MKEKTIWDTIYNFLEEIKREKIKKISDAIHSFLKIGCVVLVILIIATISFRMGRFVVYEEAKGHGFIRYDKTGNVIWKRNKK